MTSPDETGPALGPASRPRWLPGPAVTLPCLVALLTLGAWEGAIRATRSDLFPGPVPVARALVELARQGLLFRYVVASLFRVTWGFGLAVVVGVPFGLLLG